MIDLTPYDRGEVLEPKLWGEHWSDFSGPDDSGWGMVDFDDDEGCTRATVSSRKLSDGTYVLCIHDHASGEEYEIILGE